jgi:hypothetical protein
MTRSITTLIKMTLNVMPFSTTTISITTFKTTTLSITTLGIMTHGIMTFRTTTLNTITLSITNKKHHNQHNSIECRYTECVMLSVGNKPAIQSVIMLSVLLNCHGCIIYKSLEKTELQLNIKLTADV